MVAVDVNPLIVVDGRPVAVDALVEIEPSAPDAARVDRTATRPRTRDDAGFDALFEPRGVVVAGASTHPGKFGFVALHNILAAGLPGPGRARRTSKRRPVLGHRHRARHRRAARPARGTSSSCARPPRPTPTSSAPRAKQGIRAAFVTSAGYGEAGDGRAAAPKRELVELASELGILLAGPNGQGVVSTPARLCAQIVAPYPPAGRIAIASQSGNFVSSFQNWAVQTGVGVSRAVSAGNAAAVTIADYLDYYADDPETAVSLAYVEGVTDGRALYERLA